MLYQHLQTAVGCNACCCRIEWSVWYCLNSQHIWLHFFLASFHFFFNTLHMRHVFPFTVRLENAVCFSPDTLNTVFRIILFHLFFNGDRCIRAHWRLIAPIRMIKQLSKLRVNFSANCECKCYMNDNENLVSWRYTSWRGIRYARNSAIALVYYNSRKNQRWVSKIVLRM